MFLFVLLLIFTMPNTRRISINTRANAERSRGFRVSRLLSRSSIASLTAFVMLFQSAPLAHADAVSDILILRFSSLTDVLLDTLSESSNEETIDQNQENSGDNYDQDATSQLAAAADADGTQTGTSTNTLAGTQDAGPATGQGTQHALFDIGSKTLGFFGLFGGSSKIGRAHV